MDIVIGKIGLKPVTHGIKKRGKVTGVPLSHKKENSRERTIPKNACHFPLSKFE